MEVWFEEEIAADLHDWSDLLWCFDFDPITVTASLLAWVPGPDGQSVSSFPAWRMREMSMAEASVREGMRATLGALSRKWHEMYPDEVR
jgi:hypothetical protein